MGKLYSKLLIAIIVSTIPLAACGQSASAPPPLVPSASTPATAPAPAEYHLVLTPQEVSIIASLLSKGPWEAVDPLIRKVAAQIQEQKTHVEKK